MNTVRDNTGAATFHADGLDLAFITVTVADKDGQLVPRSRNALKLTVSGPGEIVATDTADGLTAGQTTITAR